MLVFNRVMLLLLCLISVSIGFAQNIQGDIIISDIVCTPNPADHESSRPLFYRVGQIYNLKQNPKDSTYSLILEKTLNMPLSKYKASDNIF